MKKFNSSIAFGLIVTALVLMFSSCSDDPNYSKLPVFSDIAFNTSAIHVGNRVTATAVQYRKGSLLNGTSYAWAITGYTTGNMEYNNGVVYDNNKANPECTFTAPSEAGTYTITFTATYKVSGSAKVASTSSEIADGTVTYNLGSLKGTVYITKTFTVLP